MLWLCLHFPNLAVEVFTRGAEVPVPLVVTEGKGARRRVAAASPEAAAAGVRPGLALGGAHALVPDLCSHPRDPAAEARALDAVAAWAGRFTPWVSLAESAVLLEVQGSLGLFGGLGALLSEVRQGAALLGYGAALGAAPTPLAAELLARSGRERPVTRLDALPEILAGLPLRLLPVPEETVSALGGMGVRTVGECLDQPREGLARRFGAQLPAALDRALGRLPDPRESFVPPPRFSSTLDLLADVASAESLLFGAHRLLQELEGFLRARGAGVQAFDLVLRHRDAAATRVRVGLAAPGRDPRRLLGLLRERLLRTGLTAPVSALTLEAGDVAPLGRRERDLFSAGEAGAADPSQLLERLRARLGDDAVRGLRLVSDHRPERAFRWAEPEGTATVSAAGKGTRRKVALAGAPAPPAPSAPPRPLWLLDEPAPVDARELTLVCGPERVESGWWDGGDVARDYFVAEDARGGRLWVFRERRGEGRWFVHGIFG